MVKGNQQDTQWFLGGPNPNFDRYGVLFGFEDGDVVLQDLLDWMQKDSSVLARKVKAGEQNGTDFWLVGSSVVLIP